MSACFITATGTGIGKTHLTTALCRELSGQGRAVNALKPLITGYDASDAQSDTALILQSLGRPVTPQTVEQMSPWRFAAPLSPDMAAGQEGRSVDFDALVAYCRDAQRRDELLFVEGVGGIMAPLDARHTVLDWMVALGWPVLLVAGTYLGTLSHALTALTVLAAKGVPVQAVVLNESAESTAPASALAKSLQRFMLPGVPLVVLPRQGRAPSLAGSLGLC